MIIFLSISLNMCFGCLKEPSHRVLLSTHNICFGLEIRKIIFSYTLLSGGLVVLMKMNTIKLNHLENSITYCIIPQTCFFMGHSPCMFFFSLILTKNHGLHECNTT